MIRKIQVKSKEKKKKDWNYNSLLEAAGDIFIWITLIMYNGRALIATITATFQANVRVTTKERSREPHQMTEEGILTKIKTHTKVGR